MNERIKKNYGRDTSLIYYDVTNYYFETDDQNDFLKRGVCKELKQYVLNQDDYVWLGEEYKRKSRDCH